MTLRQAIAIARRDVKHRWLRDILWLCISVGLVILIGDVIGSLISRTPCSSRQA